MRRGGNPKSPRKDDEIKHRIRAVRSLGQHTHAEAAKDPEPVADDDRRAHSSSQVRSRSRKSDDER
ncbi:hypothetical protein [Streptomyces xantholiticus]|uniref:Uncharacterized protein n=1 Tax=Streptomyces xantholiticus TaxID=68285 RepID=A0ABV1UYT6_9ACTN